MNIDCQEKVENHKYRDNVVTRQKVVHNPGQERLALLQHVVRTLWLLIMALFKPARYRMVRTYQELDHS